MSGRVIVNSRYALRPISGVERYAVELTRKLPPDFRPEIPRYKLGRLTSQLWEQVWLRIRVRSQDLLWSPANVGPVLVPNQVVSIHDLSPLEHPEWYKPTFSLWYRLLIPRLVQRVQHIITDSEFTKQRLVSVLGISAGKVSVVPCGVNGRVFRPAAAEELQQSARRFGLTEGYFLALGSTEPRKNIKLLLQAWHCAKLYQQGMHLVLVGGKPAIFKEASLELDSNAGVQRVGYVSDRDLAVLYSGASALVYPSHYEGFGLPLLEAMACGTPVAASSAGALPEVLGDAGLSFSPTDVESLADVLKALASDPSLRRQLHERGLARAAKFSWERARAQLVRILRRELELVPKK